MHGLIVHLSTWSTSNQTISPHLGLISMYVFITMTAVLIGTQMNCHFSISWRTTHTLSLSHRHTTTAVLLPICVNKPRNLQAKKKKKETLWWIPCITIDQLTLLTPQVQTEVADSLRAGGIATSKPTKTNMHERACNHPLMFSYLQIGKSSSLTRAVGQMSVSIW